MASAKPYFSIPTHRFLSLDRTTTIPTASNSPILELDESDIWNPTRPTSPDVRKTTTLLPSKKPSVKRVEHTCTPASVSVNVPDWSNILKEEEDDVEEREGKWVPPHEYLARRRKVVSFSVHEGIGRTLKGRDLSTVRNAILEKTGFLD